MSERREMNFRKRVVRAEKNRKANNGETERGYCRSRLGYFIYPIRRDRGVRNPGSDRLARTRVQTTWTRAISTSRADDSGNDRDSSASNDGPMGVKTFFASHLKNVNPYYSSSSVHILYKKFK